MHQHFRKPLLIILFFSHFLVNAQTIHPYTHLWNEVNFVGKFNKKFGYQLDIEYYRQSPENSMNAVEYQNHLMFRPWLHYYASKNVRLSMGGAFYSNYYIPNVQRQYPENRFIFQASISSPLPKSTINNRFRFEIRNIKDKNDIFETALAARYQLKWIKPLNNPKITVGTHYITLGDEILTNWGSEVTGHRFLNQNRASVGYGYVFSKRFTLEAAYINQMVLDQAGTNLTMNHILNISYKFDVPNVF